MQLDAKSYEAIRSKLVLAEIYLEDGARASAMDNLLKARALLETAAIEEAGMKDVEVSRQPE
jgi:hypothetical protein